MKKIIISIILFSLAFLSLAYADDFHFVDNIYYNKSDVRGVSFVVLTHDDILTAYFDFSHGELLESLNITTNNSIIMDCNTFGKDMIIAIYSENYTTAKMLELYKSGENLSDTKFSKLSSYTLSLCNGNVPDDFLYTLSHSVYLKHNQLKYSVHRLIEANLSLVKEFFNVSLTPYLNTSVGDKNISFFKTEFGNFLGVAYKGNETFVVICPELDDYCKNLLVEKQEVSFFSWAIGLFLIILIFVMLFLGIPFVYGLIKERGISLKLRIKTFFALAFALTLIIYFYSLLGAIAWVLILVHIWTIFRLKYYGVKLSRKDAPKLFKIIDDVAKKMNVKPPKEVILTPDSGIGVSGFIKKKLLLGMGGILKISAKDLYCILAHEFAHLKGFDTVVGGGLMTLKASLDKIVRFVGYFARISYLFLIYIGLLIYDYIFSAFIMLYSRQREYLADIRASRIVGGKNFASALNSYVDNVTLFDYIINKHAIILLSKGKVFKNMYKYFLEWEKKAPKKDKQKVLKTLKQREMSLSKKLTVALFSTHPNIEARLKNVENIKGEKVKFPTGKAVSLIKNVEEKQIKLTQMFNAMLLRRFKPRFKKRK
ncbi:MAG: M48 family metallopeptidase [Nanoarchaeota archaeon]|nr:M48 family metallopeptidase [Nanoarchaeota archaeon]